MSGRAPPEPAGAALERAAAALRRARRPLITGHVLADGDALGSSAALWHGLVQLGKEPCLALHEPVPRIFRFLEERVSARLADSPAAGEALAGECDAFVVCDNNAWHRLGHLEAPLRRRREELICLDHHLADEPFSGIHVLDPTAAATGIIVFELLKRLGVRIERAIGDAIYSSIANDTGWFRFTNTDARAFAVCRELIEAGADPAFVSESIGSHDRPEGKRALARFLDTIEVFGGGRLAIGHVTSSALEAAGATREETEDFVNHLRTLEGVELCAFLREEAGRVKLSLRSRRGVSARGVALLFGGGGHELAAGATIPGALAPALAAVRQPMLDAIRGLERRPS